MVDKQYAPRFVRRPGASGAVRSPEDVIEPRRVLHNVFVYTEYSLPASEQSSGDFLHQEILAPAGRSGEQKYRFGSVQSVQGPGMPAQRLDDHMDRRLLEVRGPRQRFLQIVPLIRQAK